MAHGLAGTHREELKDKQLVSLRGELRSYRLNGSGMNKIVRRTSVTLQHQEEEHRRANRHLALEVVLA